MPSPTPTVGTAASATDTRPQFLGHPTGLFLLFMVEMWERFSYYGMRALLVLYLTSPTTGMLKVPTGAPAGFNPGPGWSNESASTLYGWYTGLAYLFPVVGGIIADKLLGTHRSMLVGGFLIMCGHIALAVSGLGQFHGNPIGITIFIFGLATIILGTGHFKPSVSVMVGQLYAKNDPRRDGAFSIFYMGINLGAFLCAFVCGTLGERVGWHWGFGSAAVGMFLGLAMYALGRPLFLRGIGELGFGQVGDDAPAQTAKQSSSFAVLFGIGGFVLAGLFAYLFHTGALDSFTKLMTPAVVIVLAVVALLAATWFVAIQRPVDRGPTASIFIFMMFNAFFWFAFEQAGSSMTIFTDRYTDTGISLPAWFISAWDVQGLGIAIGLAAAGFAGMGAFSVALLRLNAAGKFGRAALMIIPWLTCSVLLTAGLLKIFGVWPSVAGFDNIPTSWFQSVNPLLILMFAAPFGALWTILGKRRLNPSQPVKISLGLILLGLGFVVLVIGATKVLVIPVPEGSPPDSVAAVSRRAPIIFMLGAYFLHTMGELCLSPTGLSYVTKAAPVRFVSLLMGIWFISSFIANLAGGIVAAQTDKIEKGKIELPWNISEGTGTIQADFFLLFVLTSIGAGVVILGLTPVLKKLMRNPND